MHDSQLMYSNVAWCTACTKKEFHKSRCRHGVVHSIHRTEGNPCAMIQTGVQPGKCGISEQNGKKPMSWNSDVAWCIGCTEWKGQPRQARIVCRTVDMICTGAWVNDSGELLIFDQRRTPKSFKDCKDSRQNNGVDNPI